MTKKKNTQETVDTERELSVPDVAEVEDTSTTVATDVKPTSDVQHSAPKKRIRVRKKAARKVSAAIICANPYIRRFI